MEHLAHRLGQQCAHDAGDDDDRAGQGRNTAQLCGHVHADGCGHGFRQQGGVLFLGQVQRQRDGQRTAQTDQRAHRDARDDGGGILFQQVDFFIQRDGQRHRGRQQQIVHRGCTCLVVRIGDVAHGQKNDGKNAAQQQRVKNRLAGHLIDKGAQRKGGQRQQHAPCC